MTINICKRRFVQKCVLPLVLDLAQLQCKIQICGLFFGPKTIPCHTPSKMLRGHNPTCMVCCQFSFLFVVIITQICCLLFHSVLWNVQLYIYYIYTIYIYSYDLDIIFQTALSPSLQLMWPSDKHLCFPFILR